MLEKDKLLNKLVKKDYNNLLEELLATKEYDENVKSLILSMCYKIETAYKDYEKVKKNAISKDEYMKNLFLYIQKYCDNIKLIKKDGNKQINLIDRIGKKIECYSIEKNLLFCLSEIVKKDNIVKIKNPIINEALTKLLNNGSSINMCEPLRDFNGFSWNVLTKDIDDVVYNLVYQDLIFISGNVFLEEWINKNKFIIDYFEIFQNKIDENFGESLRKKIIINILKVAILNKALLDPNFKEKSESEKSQIELASLKFENSSNYITELGNEKKELNKKIKKIDQIINDKDLLHDEYKKRNEKLPLENKIFSMKVLKKMLKEEREQMLKKSEHCSYLMNPQIFLKQFDEIKQNKEYFSVLDSKDLKKELECNIFELQKNVLEIFRVKIEKAQEKQEIIKLFYELRYYVQIPISEEKKIYQIKKLSNLIEEIEGILITKAIENKVISEISESQRINVEIIKNIFSSKIISLESIEIKINEEENIWKVDFFDEDILENTTQIKEFIEKKNIKIKIKKRTKLFV